MPSGDVEIESVDVVRLMLQFCSENGLNGTFKALQAESGVSLNTVPSVEGFTHDIKAGNWDRVLEALKHMSLPCARLFDLYEQIVIEMMELREVEVARRLLRDTEVMQKMSNEAVERYTRIQQLTKKQFFDVRDAYPEGGTKEKRRAVIAAGLCGEVTAVPASRLLTLLSHAVKWQKHQGVLPQVEKFDIFRGAAQKAADDHETFPTTLANTIKFGKDSTPECAAFSPSGEYFVTGSMDGFIEIWDVETGKVRKDLDFQRNEDFMSHDAAVLSMRFSADNEMLVTACQAGTVIVWKVSTGQLMRRFANAHSKGVTSVRFNKENGQVLTSSYDATARVHGIKSGKVAIKEYRGHTSYVNDACYSADEMRVLTASSDGSCRIWDAKSMETLIEVCPPHATLADAPPCYQVVPVPQSDLFLLCTHTPFVSLITLAGKVTAQLRSGKRENGEFVACTVSPKGQWVYCVGEDKLLYCFSRDSGTLEHTMQVSEKDVVGLAHHPYRNCVVSWGQDHTVKLWAVTKD
eukprot:TRINITY_DN5467_c0_g1_i1.p1 TRINITY_DN5467_c0_g1~~TRINITY_DN5467_c0_g1_i1.p1  ORF type:complete len:520 (+),score=185.24 TRINITY_DN5467_c0_g1_i1:166-1725(+)